MVGRWSSFWVSAYFQGSFAVSWKEGRLRLNVFFFLEIVSGLDTFMYILYIFCWYLQGGYPYWLRLLTVECVSQIGILKFEKLSIWGAKNETFPISVKVEIYECYRDVPARYACSSRSTSKALGFLYLSCWWCQFVFEICIYIYTCSRFRVPPPHPPLPWSWS